MLTGLHVAQVKFIKGKKSLYFPNWPAARNGFSKGLACSTSSSLSVCLSHTAVTEDSPEIKLISQLAEGYFQKAGTTGT